MAPPDGEAAEPLAGAQQFLTQVAAKAGNLGKEAADLHGNLTDVELAGQRQSATFKGLVTAIEEMAAQDQSIRAATQASLSSSQQAKQTAEAVAAGVQHSIVALDKVASVAKTISQIAFETRIVSLNAIVEAGRVGAAGRGFAVVAQAVEALATKAADSSREIEASVGELSLRLGELNQLILDKGGGAAPRGDRQESVESVLAKVNQGVENIDRLAERNTAACDQTTQTVQQLDSELKNTTSKLRSALARSEACLQLNEGLIELMAESGIETDDSPFIGLALDSAQEVEVAFEHALSTGAISESSLFDEHYGEIAGSNPKQFRSAFLRLCDRLLPPIQEPVLQFSPKIVFCVAVDRNGYLPTHNQKFSRPQGADPTWNAANCRNRRIFADRTGIAAAKNQRRFLLQTYRRDMGNRFVIMKDLSCPIRVRERHWGGLRIAYMF